MNNVAPPPDPADAFVTQARLHYRMAKEDWAHLSPLAAATLIVVFSGRVRIAAGVPVDKWQSMPAFQLNQYARAFNMGNRDKEKL
jgi:hypothetical protein